MARRVHIAKHNKDLLRVLHSARPKVRKAILKEADKDIVCTLCEISDNLLCGNLPLNKSHKDKISKHKSILRRLAKRGEHWKSKKKVITQSGGAFVPLLISALLSAFGSRLFS